jgi:hypothetical protein
VRINRIVFSGFVAAALAGAPAVAIASRPAPELGLAAGVSGMPGPADATPSDLDVKRYSELEAASPEASEFEGGSAGVYIGISGGVLALILIGVLLWVLL